MHEFHQSTLRRNIWRGLLSATDQEIHDGMSFYPGAHGICQLFSRIHSPITTSQVAGIYAALSPMNGWLTNVSNVLDILRYGPFATVNTSQANKQKALDILHTSDPLTVLSGHKVRAFYQAISNPHDTIPLPIDRHLICLALSAKLSNSELSRVATDHYSAIERAYLYLGSREGLGNRLASIAWFVQRRISRGQFPIPHPDSPYCCSRPMYRHGTTRRSGLRVPMRRFRCPVCGEVRREVAEVPLTTRRLVRRPASAIIGPSQEPSLDPTSIPSTPGMSYDVWQEELSDLPSHGLLVWYDSKGRACVTLHTNHPYANSAGYQRLARFLIAESIGDLPSSSTHTHHKDGNLRHDHVNNLDLVDVAYHGSLHASALFVGRGVNGKFQPLTDDEIGNSQLVSWPRYGAVTGNAARQL